MRLREVHKMTQGKLREIHLDWGMGMAGRGSAEAGILLDDYACVEDARWSPADPGFVY